MRILGIETSADETVAAVVEDGHRLLSSVIASSLDLHTAYGGIVPEIAARSHIEVIIPVIEQTLADAKTGWDQIDAIAVTQGPGLVGSLLIGVMTARTLAITKNKPLRAVNHVLAHTYANFITDTSLPGYALNPLPQFPFLVLTVSGGHSQLVLFESHDNRRILGQTLDDAVGEAYDKVAKILGLPYPGGPSVDKMSQTGDPTAIKLPKAKLDNPYDFSFSGLKTAVLRAAQQLAGKDYTFPSLELPKALSDDQKADLAASFQKTAVDTLCDATAAAAAEFQPKTVVLAGGVAANQALRAELAKRLNNPGQTPGSGGVQGAGEKRTEPYMQYGEGVSQPATPQSAESVSGTSGLAGRQAGASWSLPLLCPDIKLCTDNAAMIAAAAFYQPEPAVDPYKLEVIPNL